MLRCVPVGEVAIGSEVELGIEVVAAGAGAAAGAVPLHHI